MIAGYSVVRHRGEVSGCVGGKMEISGISETTHQFKDEVGNGEYIRCGKEIENREFVNHMCFRRQKKFPPNATPPGMD